jgi:hypothetical protein
MTEPDWMLRERIQVRGSIIETAKRTKDKFDGMAGLLKRARLL